MSHTPFHVGRLTAIPEAFTVQLHARPEAGKGHQPDGIIDVFDDATVISCNLKSHLIAVAVAASNKHRDQLNARRNTLPASSGKRHVAVATCVVVPSAAERRSGKYFCAPVNSILLSQPER